MYDMDCRDELYKTQREITTMQHDLQAIQNQLTDMMAVVSERL